MRAYIIRRLLLIIPTLFLVTSIVFLLVRFIPGDVIDTMMAEMGAAGGGGLQAVETTKEQLRARLGLDVPIYTQYARWLGIVPTPEYGYSGILQGSLGRSLWRELPIWEEVLPKIPVSLELGILAITLGIAIALPIGIYSAIRQDTIADYSGRTVAILAISLPGFWLATIVMVYPAIWWQWMPSIVYIPITQDLLGNLRQFLLPAFIMAMVSSGTKMRMTRTMMLEVLRQDYIRTAWSKGLTERTVIMRHALKNALIPVVTIIGLQIPILIGGSVIMESIFNLPGIGRYMLQAINTRDYPVISAINVILASFVLMVNLVVDLTYAWLDPRVQYR